MFWMVIVLLMLPACTILHSFQNEAICTCPIVLSRFVYGIWTPPQGRLVHLLPAESPGAAFADMVQRPLETWSGELSFGCFVAELGDQDCPSNLADELTEQVALALRGQAEGALTELLPRDTWHEVQGQAAHPPADPVA